MKEQKTADYPLSRSVTDDFISDLKELLHSDKSVEGEYLSNLVFSKFTDPSPIEASKRRDAAIEKWLSTELNNATTNRRILALGHSSGDLFPGVSISRFTSKVRGIIARILPWAPSLNLQHGGFSGGASTSKKRAHSHPAMKFLDKADVTRRASSTIRELISNTRWADTIVELGVEPNVVEGNVLFTVPKNSDIDRVACKEPDLNMFFQKSIGNQIRYLLLREGINLNDQRINGELARIGSIDDSLMTVDLSSASDSISKELVRLLLPNEWFYYCDLFRSHSTVIDGSVHTNEMFSSMGNGFTFELESLLFYSITRAVAYFSGVKGRISVYGDDIIAPSEIYANLISAMTFYGFSVNVEKTFVNSPYKESCGRHWYLGREITPFYLRRPFTTISDLILTLNQLINWSSRCLGVVDPHYEALILKYSEYIPKDLWGGQDLTSRSSLVSGDRPRYELVRVQRPSTNNHRGGLLLWLFLKLSFPNIGAVDTTGASQSFTIKKRRSRAWSSNDVPIFLSKYLD